MMSKGFLRNHASFLIWLLVFGDLVGLVVCGHAAFSFYVPDADLYGRYQSVFLLSALLWLIISSYMEVYAAWRGVVWYTELFNLAWVLCLVLISLLLISVTTKSTAEYSRVWMLLWGVFCFTWLLLERVILRSVLSYLRARGVNQRYVAIVSSGGLGRAMLSKVKSSPHAGLVVNGYFSDDEVWDESLAGLDCMPLSDLTSFIESRTVDQVWLALPLFEKERLHDSLHALRHQTCDIRFLPDTESLSLFQKPMSELLGMTMLDISVGPMDGTNRIVKSFEDKIISILILIAISPILLFIAIGVKFSSSGPILYRQERVSWNGKTFGMYKFRSMPVNTEAESGAVWAKGGESRATSFGAFLRRTSLDELPQFFNVLMGDMSIVGPRPERPVFVEQFKDEVPGYMQKHKVKAGITGWAQVNGWRGDTCIKTRVEHDLYYINTWSLWFDLKIIFLTLFKGFVHKNAY